MRGGRLATTVSTTWSCPPLPRGAVDQASELVSAMQRAKGTVTEFLEYLAEEPIDADILSQSAGPLATTTRPDLGVPNFLANMMWEIESGSVGNGSGQGAVDPGEPGLCRYPHSGVPTNLGRSRRQNSGPTGRHGRIGRAVWPHWKDWGSGAAKLPVERPRASGKDSIDPNVTKAEATEPRRTNQRGSGRPGRDSAITHGHPNHPSSRTHAFGEQEHCRSWILDSRTPQ